MINLLPDLTKKQIRAARVNFALVRYVIFLLLAAIFLLLACITAYALINNTKLSADQIIANKKPSNSYTVAKAKESEISNKLLITKNVLSKQTLYSEIITNIAAELPTGVIIDSLNLSNQTINSPIELTAKATTSQSRDLLKANFIKSKNFSNFSQKSIFDNTASTTNYKYEIKFSIQIRRTTI